jgi:hypothetical protein
MRRTAAVRAVLAFVVAGVAGCGTPGGADEGGPSWAYDEIFDNAGKLSDVAAPASDDIWVAGSLLAGADSSPDDGYLLHHDGTRWQRQPMPEVLGRSVYEGRLDPLGSGELLLTATLRNRNAPRMAHWDGTRWSAVPEIPDGRPLADLKAFSADDIWVLGADSQILHWDGARWTVSPLPVTAASLDGTAPDDLWAVGHQRGESEESGHETAQPAALHWDGRSWCLTDTPAYRFPDPVPSEPTATLDHVLALAMDDVRAYGSHTFNHGEVENEPLDEAIRLRWDGSRWSRQPAAPGQCDRRVPLAADGRRGLLLDGNWYLSSDGTCTKIKRPRLPNKGGIRPTSQQSLWLNAIEAVPGTDKVLGVGHVQVNQSGNPTGRSVIVTLKR